MKKTKLLATIVLASAAIVITGASLARRIRINKHKRRLQAISDAGYELAYDMHHTDEL